MHVLIISDAWEPQVNGVVRTLQSTKVQLEAMGHRVSVIGPHRFHTLPCPGYREIRISIDLTRRLHRLLDREARSGIDCVHIATEGPLGWSARAWCLRRRIAFTTSCHTRFPEYIRMRVPIPLEWTYAVLRRFHGAAIRTLVRSPSQKAELLARGFRHLAWWPGGVDTELFRPRPRTHGFKGPVAMYVGRVATEKSVDEFLAAPFVGTKVVVGDGPARRDLEARFPDTIFTGFQHGEALASLVSEADVFVFPSKTDTLGLVMLEALACGVPVAAYPVPGPEDVIDHGRTGFLSNDLSVAMMEAQKMDPRACRAAAEAHGWAHCSQRFLELLQPIAPSDLEQADTDSSSTLLPIKTT